MLFYSATGYIVKSLLIAENSESSEPAHSKDEISQVYLASTSPDVGLHFINDTYVVDKYELVKCQDS